MKELTLKQKIEFCDRYLNLRNKEVTRTSLYLCDHFRKYTGFDMFSMSEGFPELYDMIMKIGELNKGKRYILGVSMTEDENFPTKEERISYRKALIVVLKDELLKKYDWRDDYEVGKYIYITSKPYIWSSFLGGEFPLDKDLKYPLILKIEKLGKNVAGELTINAGGFGWNISKNDEYIRLATEEEIKSTLYPKKGTLVLIRYKNSSYVPAWGLRFADGKGGFFSCQSKYESPTKNKNYEIIKFDPDNLPKELIWEEEK